MPAGRHVRVMGVGDAQGQAAPGLRCQHRAGAAAGVGLGIGEVHVRGADQDPAAGRRLVELAGGRQPPLWPPPARGVPEQQPRRGRLGGGGGADRVQGVGRAAPAPGVAAVRVPGGLGQVQVRVDEPGQHVAAGQIQHLVGGGRRAGRAGACDPVAVQQQPALPRRAGRAGPHGRAGY